MEMFFWSISDRQSRYQTFMDLENSHAHHANCKYKQDVVARSTPTHLFSSLIAYTVKNIW